MPAPVEHTTNFQLWLKIFTKITAKDPAFALDKDTSLIHEGADTSFYPEIHIMGAFKFNGSFVVITFVADASWDEISNLRFESTGEIDDLKLLSKKEQQLLRNL